VEEFQQHYPTYNFKERDVVLAEFDEAQRIANTQSKLYGQLANFLIAFVTIGISILLKTADTPSSEALIQLKKNIILFDIFLALITLVILRYFIELQRTIVINSRKVVTLRRMLGLDYGHLQLTLPNWRVEGATNPFVIKLFPGWSKFGSSPFWTLVLALNIIWYLTFPAIGNEWVKTNWWVVSLVLSIFYALTFRIQLRENHETLYLLFVKFLSRIIAVRLIKDFEYTLYRAKLSVQEKYRLKFDNQSFEKILIEVEDKRFKTHKGIDLKSLVRSVLSQSKIYRQKKGLLKSGGSTITMQLCRTLFIPSNQRPITRKTIEILLAFWVERQFSKSEILSFYITSVRFERSVNGIIKATRYFFPNKSTNVLTPEESFFLVERLSNISSTYRKERVTILFNIVSKRIKLNKEKIDRIYARQETENKITHHKNDYSA
jgi:penicillin-binding protein 1A